MNNDQGGNEPLAGSEQISDRERRKRVIRFLFLTVLVLAVLLGLALIASNLVASLLAAAALWVALLIIWWKEKDREH